MEKPPVTEAMETRVLDGRRTKAQVCRPFRAGRVWAPIFRWFLHRLLSASAFGAEPHFFVRKIAIFYPRSSILDPRSSILDPRLSYFHWMVYMNVRVLVVIGRKSSIPSLNF